MFPKSAWRIRSYCRRVHRTEQFNDLLRSPPVEGTKHTANKTREQVNDMIRSALLEGSNNT